MLLEVPEVHNLNPTQYMGGCQNYGPFLGPYYNTGPNTGPNLLDQKGTIILTIPHILCLVFSWGST